MSKGNISKIDNLGRVVVPKSIRKALNIQSNSEISMYVENRKLIITKSNQICSLCDTKDISCLLYTSPSPRDGT